MLEMEFPPSTDQPAAAVTVHSHLEGDSHPPFLLAQNRFQNWLTDWKHATKFGPQLQLV